jgi:hypothetical protein
MQIAAEDPKISAWKVYTPFGGWRLDDDKIGIPFLERARAALRAQAHKGLPLPGFDPASASPEDIGVVAKATRILVPGLSPGFETAAPKALLRSDEERRNRSSIKTVPITASGRAETSTPSSVDVAH